MTKQEDWVSFTEESNALDYLRKTVEFAKRVETALEDWKWVVLSLYGALYGFMICALKGTNPDNVAYTKGQQKRLISFGEALKRCQNPVYMSMMDSSRILNMSQTQKRSLGLIQEEFRDAFAHYQPRLWAIELHGMPEIVMDGLDVVRFLGVEASNYAHFNADDRKQIDALVTEGKSVLTNTRLFAEIQKVGSLKP
jgi:hypothetical protein